MTTFIQTIRNAGRASAKNTALLGCNRQETDTQIVLQKSDGGAGRQRWMLTPHSTNSYIVKVAGGHEGKSVILGSPQSARGGVRLVASPYQAWTFALISGREFKISVKDGIGLVDPSARFLEADPATGVVSLKAENPSAFQVWKCVEVGDGPTPPAPSPTPPPSWISKNANPLAETDAMVARAQAMGPKNVVFVGDSITNELNLFPTFAAHLPILGSKGATGILGVGGDTIENALWRLAQPNGVPKSDVYVICIGTNDLMLPPVVIADRLRCMIDFVRSRNPGSYTVVLGLFWRQGFLDAVKATNVEYRSLVDSVGDPRVSFENWPEELTSSPDFIDGVHPTDSGWSKILDRLFPLLASLLRPI